MLKSFDELQKDQQERERLASQEHRKPQDQEFSDPLGLLTELSNAKTSNALANEAVGAQAVLAKKAAERREREAKARAEEERKRAEQAAQAAAVVAAGIRATVGGAAAGADVDKGKLATVAADASVGAGLGAAAKVSPVKRVQLAVREVAAKAGCCVVS